MPLVRKIDHVAIVVKDVDAAVQTFSKNFGFPLVRRGELPGLGIRNAYLEIGDATLELFTPTKDANPAAAFMRERGEGTYLLSLAVDNLDRAAESFQARGIEVRKVTSDDGSRLGFISPRHTHGVLLQLIEQPAGA